MSVQPHTTLATVPRYSASLPSLKRMIASALYDEHLVGRVGSSYDKDEDKANVLHALATLPYFFKRLLLPQSLYEADGLATYLWGYRHSTQFRHFGKEYPEIGLEDDCLDNWLTGSVTFKTATSAKIMLNYIMWKLAPEIDHADSEMKSSAERGESGYHRLVTLQIERFGAGEDTQAKTWGQSSQDKLRGIARENKAEREFLHRRMGYLCEEVWANRSHPVHVSYLDAKLPSWDDKETDQMDTSGPSEEQSVPAARPGPPEANASDSDVSSAHLKEDDRIHS